MHGIAWKMRVERIHVEIPSHSPPASPPHPPSQLSGKPLIRRGKEERGRRNSSPGNERLLPSSGMGFLPCEHLRDGLDFPFLLHTWEQPAAPEQERGGKQEKLSLFPWRRTGCSQGWEHPCGLHGQGKRAANPGWDILGESSMEKKLD